MSPEEEATILEEARSLLRRLAREHPQWAAKLLGVQVRLSGRLTSSAGVADARKRQIRLSAPLFGRPENRDQLANTVTHEAAHLIVGASEGHGARWVAVHRALGGNGERCHRMETGASRRQAPREEARCTRCGDLLLVGPIRMRRMRSEELRYRHRGCGGILQPADAPGGTERAPDLAARVSPPPSPAARCTRCGALLSLGPIRRRRLEEGQKCYQHRGCGGRLELAEPADPATEA